MRLPKNVSKTEVRSTAHIDLNLDKDVWDKILAMEDYTKISKEELVTTALKRFISAHKDYLPSGQ